jgi:hypothetical protein
VEEGIIERREFACWESEIVLALLGGQMLAAGRSEAPREERSEKKIFWPGGRRNRLKRLNPDKEIQDNPSFFL